MNKINITWKQVFSKLSQIDFSGSIVYGIPKGGMILAGFLKHAKITHLPDEANIILDDIIDSGKTMDMYQKKYPGKKYFALIDKINNKEDVILFKNCWIVFPWEKEHPNGEETVEQNIIRQLQFIGEDVTREGLIDTPSRVIKSWKKLYEGYSKKPEDVLTTFSADGYDQIILLKDIELYSTCEHHMIPFFGKAHIAYLPDPKGKIVGISKLARLLEIYARRLQIQERLGEQITLALMEHLQPLGAACIIEAQHLCMKARGVEKQNSIMVTSSMKGVFMDNPSAKQELLQLIKG
ncbi:MAG: GTP cyclohydrolase I FolE [Candidatus Paceibacterota bacterium]|jgi:GTP cyclohydrolase I